MNKHEYITYRTPQNISESIIFYSSKKVLAIPIHWKNEKKPYMIIIAGEIIEKDRDTYILKRVSKNKKSIEKKINDLFGKTKVFFLK
ncbi:MAG: hypothetical protein QXW65_02875 [Candidatus Pacearchaeota archaeon]